MTNKPIVDYDEAVRQAEKREAERQRQLEEDIKAYNNLTSNTSTEIIYEGYEEEPVVTEDVPEIPNRMINIQFRDNELLMERMQQAFNRIGFDALFMTHYQLSTLSEYTPIQWKEFITDPRVSAFINEELDLLKKSKVASMLRDVERSKNVGQAQLLNTLLNQTKGSEKKEGPAFVYCWVPLNENEQHATNVEVQDVSLTKYFENQERPDTF